MPNEAKALALRWLAQRSLTIAEAANRLEEKGFAMEEIDNVLERLSELGLLDDRKIAEQVLSDALGRHDGPYGARVRMQRRRIPDELIDDVMQAHQDEINWQEIAEPLGQRYDVSNPKERARLARRLARQGFPTRIIKEVISAQGGDDAYGAHDY